MQWRGHVQDKKQKRSIFLVLKKGKGQYSDIEEEDDDDWKDSSDDKGSNFDFL